MRKKVKSAVVIMLSFTLAGVVLTGCGENQQSQQDMWSSVPLSVSQENGQDNAVGNAESETVEKPEQSSERYEDNFAVDNEAAKKFAEKVKDAVAQKDLEALAELAAFPIYVGLPDVGVVKTKEDFLKLGAETVFTDRLLESVEAADIDNFQPSMAGFSISDGSTANIIFGVVEGVLVISGINY